MTAGRGQWSGECVCVGVTVFIRTTKELWHDVESG